MKKRLLLSALAFVGALSAFALNSGDYVYTPDAKFKVTGENLFTNGDFTQGTSLTDGWTSDGSNSISFTEWTIGQGLGPDGSNALISNYQSGGKVASSVRLEAGEYLVSYKVSVSSTLSLSKTIDGTNSVVIYTNNDATLGSASDGYVLKSEAHTVSSDSGWVSITDTVNVSEACYLVIDIDNMAAETMFADFEVNKISAVFDDRIALRKIAYCEELANAKDWAEYNTSGETNGLADFQEAIEAVSETVADPSSGEDIATMEDLMTALDEAIADFLDANSADMSGSYTGWEDSSKGQKLTSKGDWVLVSGRWFHCNNVYTDEDIAQIYMDISAGYTLPTGSATLTKTWEPGRYMFAMDLKGNKNFTKSAAGDLYTANYDDPLKNVVMFANNDTVDVDVPTRYYTRKVMFFTADDVENNINIGAAYTSDNVVNGGQLHLATARVRMLGTSTSEQNKLTAIAGIITQRNALKDRLDSVAIIKDSSLYPWNKQTLIDSTAVYQALYDASLKVVDEDGNLVDESVLLTDAKGVYSADTDYETELLANVRSMNSIISKYYSGNSSYTALVADVAKAKESYNAANHANASASAKTTLGNLISEADALIAGVTAVNDSANFAAKDEALNDAVVAFEFSCATPNNPASLTITNPNFASNVSGWTLSANDTSKEAYKRGANTSYASGYCAQVWRGATASPNSKFVNSTDLAFAGVYEYRAKGHALNETKSYDLAMADIVDNAYGRTDTIFADKNQVRLFFGLDGAPDSVRVHSRKLAWSGSSQWDGYVGTPYSVVFNKAADGDEKVEFGMSSYTQTDKAGSNAYGFGDNELIYYGSDISACYIQFGNEMLTKIENAKTLIADTAVNSALLDAGRRYLVDRLVKAVDDASAYITYGVKGMNKVATINASLIQDILNASHAIDTYSEAFEAVATGVEGVFVTDDSESATSSAKGVYNISGAKVANSVANLPAGLYIVNGKKVVVK